MSGNVAYEEEEEKEGRVDGTPVLSQGVTMVGLTGCLSSVD